MRKKEDDSRTAVDVEPRKAISVGDNADGVEPRGSADNDKSEISKKSDVRQNQSTPLDHWR